VYMPGCQSGTCRLRSSKSLVPFNVVSVALFIFTCAKRDSARYEEAGSEENDQLVLIAGKVRFAVACFS
jgi:hypothetical protein